MVSTKDATVFNEEWPPIPGTSIPQNGVHEGSANKRILRWDKTYPREDKSVTQDSQDYEVTTLNYGNKDEGEDPQKLDDKGRSRQTTSREGGGKYNSIHRDLIVSKSNVIFEVTKIKVELLGGSSKIFKRELAAS